MQGQIIKNISNDYTVLVDDKMFVCKARGKFRNLKITPLVGDQVIIDEKNNYILEILPRKNSLVRPPVSNIDQVIIVASVKNPNFDTNLLDKMLAIVEFNNITPIICLTKLDLLNEQEINNINVYRNYYEKIGYKVLINTDLDQIKETLREKVNVFTGQSGAGKSTLLNNLDSHLNIKTNEISKALNRGKHTTRHTELINICNAWIADTPGFSSLEFSDMKNSDIRDNFIEFNEYKEKCKYKDCMHNLEDECEIKKRVNDNTILKSRYENYLKFIRR